MVEVFHSYAQNYEDVLLHRCFQGVERGRYIDVGASEPTRHSVTYDLYLQGWSGINVEPIMDRIAELRTLRPRDVSLHAAAGEVPGQGRLNRSNGRGGTSTLKIESIETPSSEAPADLEMVKILTLSDVCEEHFGTGVTPDLIKIDVEGSEGAVLAGADFSRWQPSVLIVEGSTDRPDWEALIPMTFVHHDGVNRWYLRDDMMELADRLTRPISIHDHVRRADATGSPVLSEQHQDHAWACGLAHAVLGNPRPETVEFFVESFLSRMPPHEIREPLTQAIAKRAIRRVLGRNATDHECLEAAETIPALTYGTYVEQLVRSEVFLKHWGRALASF